MDRPRCGKCGGVMTPADSKLRPELFLHDRCLPDEFQPPRKPVTTDLTPAALTPLDMIRVATEKGFDADQLEKLVRLNEQWEAGEARKEFAQAMTACQEEMPVIVTDARNSHTNSTYARLETITTQIKPVYVRHGLSLSFGTEDSKLPGHYRIVCDVRHRRGHKERYQIDMPADGIGPKGNPIGGMNGPQAGGSTISYGRRYLTGMIFNLAIGGEDNDAIGRAVTVSAAQVDELRKLVLDAGRTEDKFLAWAGVTSFEELSLSKYHEAKRMLGPKKGGGR